MRDYISDFKIIIAIMSLCILYPIIFMGRYNLLNSLDMLQVIIISIYICSVIVVYNFKKDYVNNLYKYLSVAFLSIGIISFTYMFFARQYSCSYKFCYSSIKLNLIFSIYESCLLIYSFFQYKKKTNCKKFTILIILFTIFIIYTCIRKNYSSIDNISGTYSIFLKNIIVIMGILLKFYLLRVIYKLKDDITDNTYKQFKAYIYFGIISQIIYILSITSMLKSMIVVCFILRYLEQYCVIKMMVLDIIRNPQELLYNELAEKTKQLEETIEQLKKTNSEMKILYSNYERHTQEEEIKNEILSNISHEFKTPVNVIYSAVQTQDLLKNEGRINEVAKYNNIIRQNCNRLIRLINNFIDVTRFQKGSIEADFRLNNVVEITENIVISVRQFAYNKNINIIFDTSSEEIFSLIDIELYDRLLLNLLSNAIKYTNVNGCINVSINELDENIEISIEDNGIGINAEYLKVIFNRFERADKSYSRNNEGSGLGLNIAKWIVEVHKGSIDIKSIEEKGTTVKVNIPKSFVDVNTIKDYPHRLQNKSYVKYEVDVEMSDIYI